MPEVNQLVVSGVIASQIHAYPNRVIFMLHNDKGRFYVQYAKRKDDPAVALALARGVRVMIQGSLFSVPIHGSDAGRIEAEQILLLEHEGETQEWKRGTARAEA